MKKINLIQILVVSVCFSMSFTAWGARVNPLANNTSESNAFLLCKLQACAGHTVALKGFKNQNYQNCIEQADKVENKKGDCQRFFKAMQACAKAHAKGKFKSVTVADITDKKTLDTLYNGATGVSAAGGSAIGIGRNAVDCSKKNYLRYVKDREDSKKFHHRYGSHR
ncbi:MAG: hypothetical protein AAGA27_06495 [Pseudomonadota bacterium]